MHLDYFFHGSILIDSRILGHERNHPWMGSHFKPVLDPKRPIHNLKQKENVHDVEDN